MPPFIVEVKMKPEIIVIGAGPAGMMSAYFAASNGANVTVIEKNDRPGRKLLLTGKGRCNVTNNCDNDELVRNTAKNGRFLYSAFSSFSTADTISFFESEGVPLKTERGKRVFPVSDKSSDINNALIGACKNKNVKFLKGNVNGICAENGKVRYVSANGTKLFCDACILATGGCSYRATGSDGKGYKLACDLGHTLVPPKPSLVPVVCEGSDCERMNGLMLKNVSLKVENEKGKLIYSDFGELTFAPYGLTGATVLSASCHLDFQKCGKYIFAVDLKPALDEKQLDARLLRDFAKDSNKKLGDILRGLMPRELIGVFIDRSGISSDTKANSITQLQRRKIISLLKRFEFTAVDFRDINEAIITSGGISVKEIDPKTMQSKLVKGLYFAGEIIDVDAYTGGFNLQIAFSTGASAGKNSVREFLEHGNQCSN